jgi:hypothetical protein
MFIMTMPATFRIGDSARVRINGEPATLRWQDAQTLVINGHDVRKILAFDTGFDGAGRACQTFTCSDATAEAV